LNSDRRSLSSDGDRPIVNFPPLIRLSTVSAPSFLDRNPAVLK
jgi:hypothetical protein